ncbi:hypothetical protein DPMN_153466 [Dreissena polymorpha]|uniref:Uncharacterized protein n=2 Tax=Dreissena polymorpha TaxID=45954 RepID=A0A9D4J8Y1_DREPO|nr:hypothetical protein DPMN_153466 [Dreissena polymorpha]
MSKSGDLSLKDDLSYELSPHDPSLFEAKNILRKADKPQIIQAIRDHAENASSDAVMQYISETDCVVLGGGFLLHRTQWKNSESYAGFAVRHCGQETVVLMITKTVLLSKTTHTRDEEIREPYCECHQRNRMLIKKG